MVPIASPVRLRHMKLLIASFLDKWKFDIQLLEGNDNLTRFYTGMPTYHSFMVLAEYLEPKVKKMRV